MRRAERPMNGHEAAREAMACVFFSGKVHGEAYSYEAQMIMYLNYLSTCGVMNEYISLLSSLLWAARLQAS